MKQQAIIVRRGNKLMAEVVRSEACQQCRACNFGQQEHVYIDVGSVQCAEGDEVTIEIHDGSVSKASVMAYGLPVITLLTGLFIGSMFSDVDYIQALCALAGLGVGLAVVRIIDRRIKKTGKYEPRVTLEKSK